MKSTRRHEVRRDKVSLKNNRAEPRSRTTRGRGAHNVRPKTALGSKVYHLHPHIAAYFISFAPRESHLDLLYYTLKNILL